MEHPPTFNSVEDECRYWKERAKLYQKEWTDSKQEFDEFVEDSRQLEAEMEATLEQKETVMKDLRKKLNQLEKDNESLRMKADSHDIEFNNLEKQLNLLQNKEESMKTYTRQLEQKNDDLERTNRILVESLAGFESMLDKEYEKNALLEIEVDQKESLQEEIQRLKDEKRDLKQELRVKIRPHQSNASNMNGSLENSINGLDSTPSTPSNITNNVPMNFNQSHTLRNSDNLLNGNAMAPSSRATALNIVADMLRKLNLDKTLLCSRCDKFKCICERPLQKNNDKFVNRPSTTTSTSTSTLNSSNSNINSTNLFGTNNIFQRLSQKMSGTNNSSEYSSTVNEKAMESKLKAYREQTPVQRK